MLLSILAANLFSNLYAPGLHHIMPVLGVALWAAILLTSLIRQAGLGRAAAARPRARPSWWRWSPARP